MTPQTATADYSTSIAVKLVKPAVAAASTPKAPRRRSVGGQRARGGGGEEATRTSSSRRASEKGSASPSLSDVEDSDIDGSDDAAEAQHGDEQRRRERERDRRELMDKQSASYIFEDHDFELLVDSAGDIDDLQDTVDEDVIELA